MSIRLEYSTTAKCTPAHVWQKFSKVEEWAWWNPVIGQARWISGKPWEKGSKLHFELIRPLNVKVDATITEVAPPNRVVWVGGGMLIRGEHAFSFEPQPEGASLMKTWEDFSGVGTIFLGEGKRREIVQMYQKWFEQLKIEAEKIAREEMARS